MSMRPLLAAATAAGLILTGAAAARPAVAAPAAAADFTVVSADGVTPAAAVAAITAAGGTVVARNDAVGVYRVKSDKSDFSSRVTASDALIGAGPRRAVGHAPRIEPLAEGAGLSRVPQSSSRSVTTDPLDAHLWGLRMVRADRARGIQSGHPGVRVGVMDTGLDASNPDLAPAFSRELSRNFAPDIPEVDGPCETPSCLDDVGTDDQGHGTHVAGTIAAAVNGSGVSGVAPDVTLVELKTGQDSGYFFLDSVVNGLTYAADAGLDVVNMSFYVDPWLYNCAGNPADTPEQQAAQRATIAGINRALEYAHDGGVTLVGALGNQHDDLAKPLPDDSSPNYGPAGPHLREIDNADCLSLPAEGSHVIGVSAVGPTGAKASYSNYGTEQIAVAAPGGWTQDGYGTPSYGLTTNNVLSSYPLKVLRERGLVDADGNPTRSSVLKDCSSGTCGYYSWSAGTSMASPHAAGVAALIVSQYGRTDWKRGGLKMHPDEVERRLYASAAETACPQPRLRSYAREGFAAEFDAYCAGGSRFNGFYGHGVVDAYAAVGGR